MDAVVVVLAALAGLVAASVVNRAAVRVPVKVPEERVPVRAGATCLSCGAPRHGRFALPVLSWSASCPACGERTPRREAVVEVVTAAAFAAMAVRWGAAWLLVPYLFFTAVMVAVSVIDLEHYRIPDRLVFPSLAVSVPLIAVVSLHYGEPSAITRALVGAAVYSFPLFVFHLISPRGMGFGDVKLGLLLGLFTGWLSISLVPMSLFVGGGIGVVMGLVFALLRGAKKAFPFGPALCAGAWLGVIYANQLLGR